MVRAVIDVVTHTRIVIGEDGLGIEARKYMQGHGLGGADAGVYGEILPLIIVVERVVCVASVSRSPVLSAFVVCRPIQAPEHIAGLIEIVRTSVDGVIETALGGP